MAIKLDWKIISDKERKKALKPKKEIKDRFLWKTVWFLYWWDWYQWKVVEKVDGEHYLVDATCCNIHKDGEAQQSIQPTSKLTLVDDDY